MEIFSVYEKQEITEKWLKMLTKNGSTLFPYKQEMTQKQGKQLDKYLQ